MQDDRRRLHHLILDAGGSRCVAVLAMAAFSLALSALVFVQKVAGVSDLASFIVLLSIAGGYVAWRRVGVRLLTGLYQDQILVGPAE